MIAPMIAPMHDLRTALHRRYENRASRIRFVACHAASSSASVYRDVGTAGDDIVFAVGSRAVMSRRTK
jgi:hypothetical protein